MRNKQRIGNFLVFSDLHAHNFKYGSRRVPYEDGVSYNSRLLDTLAVLDDILVYVQSQKIEAVLFGGDMFHTRALLHTDAYNLVFNKIAEISDCAQVILIPGNHDYADRHGHVHSLDPFDHLDNVYVMDDVDYAPLANRSVQVITVPYTDDITKARDRLATAGRLAEAVDQPCLLLAHLGMQGARVGSDYVLVSDGDISVSDVPQDAFSACFFGHYHEHQQLFRNGWFIGATHEQNWSDSGGTRGFLHVHVYDDGSVDFARIETQAPKFIDYQEGSTVRAQDFVRVLLDKVSSKDRDQIQQSLTCAHLDIVEAVDTSEIVLTLSPTELEPERALHAWLDNNPPDSVSVEDARKYGTAVLKEVLGDSL